MSNYSRRDFLKAAGLGAAALAAPSILMGADPPTRRRPNIIFFLVDDMGWMDSTVYGSRYYDTPNIERLARRSMRFTDAYAASPLCSPTRASILTGKYPARLGITAPAGHLPPLPPDKPLLPKVGAAHQKVLIPQSRRFLPLEERTIAETFRDSGYKTGFIGKWHLGRPEKYWPTAQGFDVNIGGGGYPGPPSYYSPYRIAPLPDGPKGEYITDRLTDEGLKYIDANKDDPFLLCMWHYAVHAPYQAKDELTKTFEDKRDPRNKQNNPVMAAMIKSMDESLGRFLDKLDELRLTDDTIIVFFSDNGGNEYDRVGPRQWVPTNNDPLRSGKGCVYEGGVRVPMMVCWPGVVRPRTECSEVVSSIDFYPTMLQMAGIEPESDKLLDGESIVPLLRQSGGLQREAVFCHFPHRTHPRTGMLCQPSTTVRKGDWKLLRFYDTSEEFPNEYELYNLRTDVGETNNLAERMPGKVKELDALITGFLADTSAIVPLKNPAYDPDALADVDGWRGSGSCGLSHSDGLLRIKSVGGDPFVHTDRVPAVSGTLIAKFRMRSDSKGGGQFFWADGKTPRFGPTVRLDFTPVHDGEWREYEVSFTATGDLKAIRIDPSTDTGSIDIDWVKLCKEDGTVVREWSF